VSVSNQSNFYPQVVETGLDDLELQIQQLAEAVDRSVKLDVTSEDEPPVFGPIIPNAFLQYNDDGTVIISNTDTFNGLPDGGTTGQVLTKLSNDDYDLTDKIAASKHFDPKKLEWKLQLAIQKLPEKQRAVFNLRYYDEMPYAEMSKVLETSEGALKASYHHAVKKIEDYILNHY
jgi:RNA polymerase sigma factor (sigma-70 family)